MHGVFVFIDSDWLLGDSFVDMGKYFVALIGQMYRTFGGDFRGAKAISGPALEWSL